MKKTKILFVLLFLGVGLVPLAAQSVRITQEMTLHPFATVLPMYKNEFGSFEKPALDITFPYSVIRMNLEGNAHEVRAAKERLTLFMGQMTGVEARCTTYSNQILFLVPARRPSILIDCGDGCDRVLLIERQKLEPNRIYDCSVHFVPERDENTITDTVFVNQGPKYHTLNLRVEPADAKVKVIAHGERRDWILENGQVSLQLIDGDYNYTIIANEHYTAQGTIHIPTEQKDTTIRLRSKLGWLSISSDSTDLQGLSATISCDSGKQVMLLPFDSLLRFPDTYTVTIKAPNYHTYKQKILISENTEVRLSPSLVLKEKIQKIQKIQEIEPIYVTDTAENCAFIHGKFPKQSIITETGMIYGKTPDYTKGQRLVLNTKGEFEKELLHLELDTEYFVWAYACNDIDTVYSNMASFSTLRMRPTENGHGYADLGLSVKWATCNIGADTPDQYGDCFAWGEVKPKTEYNSSNYSYNVSEEDSSFSTDAAQTDWGGTWRTPTDAEWTELREQCTWKWTTQNGVKGYKVTSKINGNSIFLPAAGYRHGTSLSYAGVNGYYWSSSLNMDYPYDAYLVAFGSTYVDRDGYDRCYGHSVRPVCP